MHKQIIKLGTETDWYYTENRNLYAQNRDTRMFEKTSYTENMVMELYSDTDENDVANALGKRLWDGKEYEFAVYNVYHKLVGFVYYGEREKKETEKKVFRFYVRTWYDVIVDETEVDLNGLTTAEEIQTAYEEVATEKYNNGECHCEADSFENEYSTEVTDTYKANKIYPFNK